MDGKKARTLRIISKYPDLEGKVKPELVYKVGEPVLKPIPNPLDAKKPFWWHFSGQVTLDNCQRRSYQDLKTAYKSNQGLARTAYKAA